jgi:hypothetical protein
VLNHPLAIQRGSLIIHITTYTEIINLKLITMANVVQFYVYSKDNTRKYVFQIKSGKYFKDDEEISADDYNTALEWFNANRSSKK